MDEFAKLDDQATEVAPLSKADERKAAKKEKMKQMGTLLKQTINADPTFTQKLKSLSESVAVTNTLGFGDSGNIIVDEATKHLPKDQRKLLNTSQIVGYRIAVVGENPIKYMTEEFSKDPEGKYVGQRVDKIAKPGEKFDLSRKYMTIFCSQPEISFQLSNGKVVRGSGEVKPGDMDGELEAHYFLFNDKSIKVNSDTIKLNVSTKKVDKATGTTKWEVKPEFVVTFGNLNNAKPTGRKGRGPSANKYSPQDLAANYINTLLRESGNL